MSAYLGVTKIWNSATGGWTRPADWLALPSVGAAEQKIVGLHAVWPDANFCAMTVSGAFQVDWGDGTIEQFPAGTTVYHEYLWSNANLGAATSEGWKQAIVTITPQSGQSLTSVNLHVKHNQSGLQNNYSTGWVDIAFGAPSCTSLTIGGSTVRHAILRKFKLVSCGAITSCDSLFLACRMLTSLDLSSLNTAAVTTMSGMFNSCYSLTSLDLSSFNTASVTTMASMFGSCYSLASLDLSSFNTASVTTMASMFSNCYSLTSLDLSSFNTAAVTTMVYLFNNCYSLTSLDLSSFNTASVTTMAYMFNGCYSLTSLDLSSFNVAAVTTAANMFNNCASLSAISLPAFSATLTDTTSMFGSCLSLASLIAPIAISFSVANCKMSSTALNALYNSLPSVTGKTITVTGNYGAAASTQSIATAKGWTVTP